MSSISVQCPLTSGLANAASCGLFHVDDDTPIQQGAGQAADGCKNFRAIDIEPTHLVIITVTTRDLTSLLVPFMSDSPQRFRPLGAAIDSFSFVDQQGRRFSVDEPEHYCLA